MKLWITAPNDGTPPLYAFLDTLEEKQRQKIFSLLALLLQTPEAAMREPYVKHFGIERYRALYELRAKSRNLVRITFTLRENGDICIQQDDELVPQEHLANFPAKVYWPRLVEVFESKGLSAETTAQGIQVSW